MHLPLVVLRELETWRTLEQYHLFTTAISNLHVLDMQDFDIILGLDWLFSHFAMVDWKEKVVHFEIGRTISHFEVVVELVWGWFLL